MKRQSEMTYKCTFQKEEKYKTHVYEYKDGLVYGV